MGAIEEAERAGFASRLAGAARLVGRAARGVLDLALPPQCLACEKPVTQAGGLCVACWGALKPIERPYCERLGTPFPADFGPGLLSPAAIAKPPAFDRARAVARFDGTARELVHRLKYADGVHLAKPLGAMMARAGHELLGEGALLVPVPLHRGRLWSRRFNQSALLARSVARISGAELKVDAIERVKATRPQVGLTASQRADNLAGAFRVADAAVIAGRRIVLVDDVVTTGATVDRLARLLRRARAASVDVLTFAVVVKEA
ncbi:ComF family protein [Chenggangzhangella methanolivorans]|uniref:ComF family protein n=1 Tax=Chenggangzhangella methanolivorans TaxID=1437009 RepID=A0A9E6RI40_9HYPH|nr:ComF family protein [Chenggangzhangella methanolivorans]QZO01866.1 ComF family protein [Chenggangzhangella methanolivorans]